MHLKMIYFKLYHINKCVALPDAEMLASIDMAELTVLMSTRNQYSCNAEILEEISLPELMIQTFTTSNFESFMDNFR